MNSINYKISDLIDGEEFECKINNKYCKGKIRLEYGRIYLCQDTHAGEYCEHKHGFRYSWITHENTLTGITNFSHTSIAVTEFRLLRIPKEPDYQLY